MLGISDNCPSPLPDERCHVPCEHTNKIRGLYTQEAGTRGVISTMIDAHLALQEDFLWLMCVANPNLKTIAQAAGMRAAGYIDLGCDFVCNEQKRIYAPDNCNVLEPIFDIAFYRNVIAASRIKPHPSGATLSKITDLFGWSITYTVGSIVLDIGTDDPLKPMSILHLFPVPLGEQLRVIGTC